MRTSARPGDRHPGHPKNMKRTLIVESMGEINIETTKENFKNQWKRARESTEYLILGLHFGHHKSATNSKLLSEIHDIF